MVNPLPKPLTPEEYLELERHSPVKHELVGGVMYAMAGASRRHNRIVVNVLRLLADLADGKGCRVFASDMKLRLEDAFYYPDVMAVCAPEPANEYYETDPCILVEVVSESTKTIDLREKLWAYRSLSSLQTYLVVDTEAMTIRHFFRDPTGRWQQEDVVGSGEIPLPCLGGSIELLDVYRNVFH
ncbi:MULTISPECIES: Uma2 family endonuclease [unclassified Meiothermus]|uniref:Uma2 family endonuclease n=1 Tax=unclassified Meiothermus TaxID=370471 RepID=UPI000D7C17BF|nr:MULTISPECIES: Uma2 family endonuclease [unclassified Meiothermus]PZA07038.1 Uma2 family endonuclease [Meiothermus sp. Pnk-1]RYM34283.1 Uma2 family endonuclease [Meiothermus sp. PNK-Is4]